MSGPHPTILASIDDHCLIHHFIRLHGRAPSTDELAALRNGETAPTLDARLAQADPVRPAAPGGLNRGVRREIARLINRL